MSVVKSKSEFITWCSELEKSVKSLVTTCDEIKREKRKIQGATNEAAFSKAVEDVSKAATAMIPIISNLKGLSNKMQK